MPGADQQPEHRPGRASQPVPESKRILIVDDDASLRAVVRTGLEKQMSLRCEEAGNGIDAIAKAKWFRPDLIILDVAMPMMNGYETAMVLKKECPNIPVVMLTIYGEIGKSLAETFGVRAVISKSDGIGTLLHCIRSVLGR